MQFSSVTPLIDAYMLGQISGKPIKGASIFVYFVSKNPLVLEDCYTNSTYSLRR